MDGIAAGAGTSANVPFLKDITDQDDEVQVEGSAPVNDQGAPGDVQEFSDSESRHEKFLRRRSPPGYPALTR